MTTSMTNARDNRQSVQFFDVDLFRNKLETYMRKQTSENFQPVNTKKRKLSDRWSTEDKIDMEISLSLSPSTESCDDELMQSFGKRQRGNSYYPIDDEDIEIEEISPLALPSPVSIPESHSMSSYFIDGRISEAMQEDDDANMSMSMAMRRQLSGYSEANTTMATYTSSDEDDSWMSLSASPCPPLSRASLSQSSSYTTSTSTSSPQTPNHNTNTRELDFDLDLADEQLIADLRMSKCELDIGVMAPHERNLLAALAPERYERAALIKRAFRQSEKLLDRFVKEEDGWCGGGAGAGGVEVQMDDGEYDQVFGELMQV